MRTAAALVIAMMGVVAVPAHAQSSELGLLLGFNEPINDDLGLDTGLDVFEIYYAKRIEERTALQLRLGEIDLAGEELDEGLEPEVDTEVRYALVLVEYEFDEIFGSTSLFAGPGAYEIDGLNRNDQDYGFAAGVGVDLPVARRLGVIAELVYHWISFDEKLRMLDLTAGIRFSF